MDRYSKMVIDLQSQILTGYKKNNQVNFDSIHEVYRDLSVALTEARIKGQPTESIYELIQHIEHLKQELS